jgi:peptidoglycan/xylan/chitin deacetylase (PgdA/CDA1 family)
MPSHHSIPDWVNAGRRRSNFHRIRIRRRRSAVGLGAIVLLVVLIAFASSGGRSHAATKTVNANAPLTTPVLSESVAVREHRRENRAIDRVLASGIGVVRQGGSSEREVALTFDDGPSSYTPGVVAVLKHFHVPATFFEIGQQIPSYASFTLSIVAAGYWAEDHTLTHPNLNALSPADQDNELTAAAHNLTSAGAPFPRLFRPPYGDYDANVLSTARQLGMLTVLWTIDTEDYTLPGSPRIADTVLSQATPGAIVLMHDGGGPRYQTIDALPAIIRGLRARGYTLVSVPRMMLDDPPTSVSEAMGPGGGLAGSGGG